MDQAIYIIMNSVEECQHRFKHPDMQIKSELYDEYRNQIFKHLKDNENHTDGTNTWVNPMYIYEVMKSDGKVPSDNLLRDIVNDLMWILIDTNRDLEIFHKTNTLYDRTEIYPKSG